MQRDQLDDQPVREQMAIISDGVRVLDLLLFRSLEQHVEDLFILLLIEWFDLFSFLNVLNLEFL